MNIFWTILAAAGFVGGQVYLLFCLRRLDKTLGEKRNKEPAPPFDDNGGYPDEDVLL